jgi:hypothetical protein
MHRHIAGVLLVPTTKDMIMNNFLIDIELLPNGTYVANFMEGTVVLNATNYHDAVLEADLIAPEELA